jgi:hypothetical protein
VLRIVTRLSAQEPDAWLQAGLPALYGPNASRPWVNVLRTITETLNLWTESLAFWLTGIPLTVI